jgi:hypothetical protein
LQRDCHFGRLPQTSRRLPTGVVNDTGLYPISRLIDAWNSFAGVAPLDDLKPIKKFTNRKTAVARIWKAVTRLSPLVGPVAADVAPTKVGAKKSPTTGRRAVVARPAAKRGAEPALARSKKTDVLALMRRDGGATLAEIIQGALPSFFTPIKRACILLEAERWMVSLWQPLPSIPTTTSRC